VLATLEITWPQRVDQARVGAERHTTLS
jgi:hypothetical protein